MKKIALIVGHSSKAQGCSNKNYNISEYTFNYDLALKVYRRLEQAGHKPHIFTRINGLSDLVKRVNKDNPNIAISFHCNAFNTKVSGTETLYYKNSNNAKQLATCIQTEIVNCLNLNDRGLKPVTTENGSFLLKGLKATACLLEPFFLDNDNDYTKALHSDLDLSITKGILNYISSQQCA